MKKRDPEREPDPREGGMAAMESWRQRIDAIDDQLMRLLNSRSACAVEIGRIKRELGLPVYAPEREAYVLDRVMRESPGPLEPLAVRRVFERIIDESRRLERISADEGGDSSETDTETEPETR
jgi:chorismate mutase